jgi:hypothetical protein
VTLQKFAAAENEKGPPGEEDPKSPDLRHELQLLTYTDMVKEQLTT